MIISLSLAELAQSVGKGHEHDVLRTVHVFL